MRSSPLYQQGVPDWRTAVGNAGGRCDRGVDGPSFGQGAAGSWWSRRGVENRLRDCLVRVQFKVLHKALRVAALRSIAQRQMDPAFSLVHPRSVKQLQLVEDCERMFEEPKVPNKCYFAKTRTYCLPWGLFSVLCSSVEIYSFNVLARY